MKIFNMEKQTIEYLKGDLFKIPIEELYKILYEDYKNSQKTIKNLKVSLEDFRENYNKRLNNIMSKLSNNNEEVNQKLFEYKLSEMHISMIKEIDSITKDRDYYKQKCKELTMEKYGK